MSELVYEQRHTKADAITYWPLTKKFYVGSLDTDVVDIRHDSEYTQIARLHPEKKLGEGRFEKLDVEYWRAAERQFRAGLRDTSTITNIQATQLVTQILNEEWREFNAISAFRRIAVPKLKLDIPFISTRRVAKKKVPELVEMTYDKTVESKISFNLWKNGDTIGVSDEAEFQANIAPFELEINQSAGALGKAWNDQFVTVIEGFTSVTKASWSTKNANNDFSLNNPLTHITDEIKTIQNLHNRPNTICMDPIVFSNYVSNTHVNGYDPAVDRQTTGTFPMPRYPGITAVLDLGFADTSAVLLDNRGLLFGEGPTVAEQDRNAAAGATMYYIRQFGEPLKVDNIFGRLLATVS